MTTLEEYFTYQRNAEQKYGSQTIVLYENGHFYEIYGVENEIEHIGKASIIEEVLNIKKSRKNTKIVENSRSNPLLVGFPVLSLSKYLSVLIANQFTVVFVEQTTPPPNPTRALTRVISPSTYLSDQIRPEYQFLTCIYGENNPWSVVVISLDISTGRVFYYSNYQIQTEPTYVLEDIYRVIECLNPVEVLLWMDPNDCPLERVKMEEAWELKRRNYHWIDNHNYHKLIEQEHLLEECYPNHGMSSAIEYLGLERMPSLVQAYCLLLSFAREHDKKWLNGLSIPETWERNNHLLLHYNTIYQLNLLPEGNQNYSGIRSIWDILCHTVTANGKRLLRERLLNPIVEMNQINQRYQNLETWMNLNVKIRDDIRRDLKCIGDLERIWRRMFLGILDPMECGGFLDLFIATERILKQNPINVIQWGWTKNIHDLWKQFCEEWKKTIVCDRARKYHLDTITESIFVKHVYPEIDLLQEQYNTYLHQLDTIQDELLQILKQGDGKADSSWIRMEMTERDGYFISITKKRWILLEKKLPSNHTYIVKQMPTNGIKLTSPLIVELSENIVDMKNKLGCICRETYILLIKKWAQDFKMIWHVWAKWESEYDVLSSFGILCAERFYVRPILKESEESFIEAKNLRHPLIEKIQTRIPYIPNDVLLSEKGLLIFGLNGGGKSSLLKAIGLSIVFAQIGMFVPADEFTYCPFHTLFTRILGTDNLLKGQSSFMIEMQEMYTILRESNSRTLVLGDEICRGTEIASAISIVAASIEHLAKKRVHFVFATHLHALSTIPELQSFVQWKHVEVTQRTDGSFEFGRMLKDGIGPTSYGLEVARHIIHIPEIMNRAESLRTNLMIQREESIIGYSKYNSQLQIRKCEICGRKPNTEEEMSRDFDTHHIQFQCTKDKQDCIDFGRRPCHEMNNLVVLCKEDHQNVHLGKILIHGWIETSNRRELKWEKEKEKEKEKQHRLGKHILTPTLYEQIRPYIEKSSLNGWEWVVCQLRWNFDIYTTSKTLKKIQQNSGVP